LKVQQPDEEFDVRMNEMAQNHPVVINYHMMRKLKQAADAGDEVAAMTLQAMQNGGLSGQPGRPKEPNNALQGQGIPQGQEPMGGEPDQTSEQLASSAPNMEGGVYGTEF
jgi:hypothetical protein